jgi:hypothetical protein
MPQKPPGIPVTQAARVATFARFHLRKPVAIFEPTSLAFAVWLILGGVDGAGARTQNVQIAAPLRLSKNGDLCIFWTATHGCVYWRDLCSNGIKSALEVPTTCSSAAGKTATIREEKCAEALRGRESRQRNIFWIISWFIAATKICSISRATSKPRDIASQARTSIAPEGSSISLICSQPSL